MTTASPETAALQATPEGSQAIQGANILQAWSSEVIASIGVLSDDELIETARNAHEVEKCGFKIRGACGYELRKRIIERKGMGTIGKEMSRLAKDIGCAPSTLLDDVAIFTAFEVELQSEVCLDREYYRFALAAPDKDQAIEMAHTKKEADSSYSTRDFQKDVDRLKNGDSPAKVERDKYLHIPVDEEAWVAWEEVRTHRDFGKKDNATLFKQIVFEARDYHKRK